jgi:osmotically-inducible protein OsmY
MGHEISHPGAIEVTARSGRVTLSGPILADEVDRLIARVALVSGVSDVVNRLEVHQDAGNISSLQGSGRRS